MGFETILFEVSEGVATPGVAAGRALQARLGLATATTTPNHPRAFRLTTLIPFWQPFDLPAAWAVPISAAAGRLPSRRW